MAELVTWVPLDKLGDFQSLGEDADGPYISNFGYGLDDVEVLGYNYFFDSFFAKVNLVGQENNLEKILNIV